MSVLDRFVRARRFRTSAAEYYDLAAEALNFDVRKRYLAIADHYIALAETELRADKLERKRRLEEMSAERAKKAAAARSSSIAQTPIPGPQPVKLRIIQGEGQRVVGQRRVRLPARSNLIITGTTQR
jgi:hypothetical protein